MSLRRRPRRRIVTVLAAAVVLIACAVLIGLVVSRPAPVSVRSVVIPVIDGPRNEDHVLIDATFFTPPGAGKVPAILLAHGFGQTKTAMAPEARQLARAGYAVLTWSARGFGGSTGQIGLDSPDYEVKDTEQLVSWLARQPRVLLDHPGDPRVGITGASYGGGIALLAAAYDHRIDAIVPQIVSNILDAVTALGPWRQILPSHWQFAWLEAMAPQLTWSGMIEGASVSACYALILFALAFRRFAAKYIVS